MSKAKTLGGLVSTGAISVDSSNNVGIGTSSPGAKLDVVQSGTATVAALGKTNVAQVLVGFNGTSNNYLDADNNIFRIGNGTEQMRLTSTGLGIGTSSPGAKLETSSTSAGATVEVLRLSNPGAGANTQAQLKFFTTSTNYGTISGGYGGSAPQMTFDLPNGTPGNYVWQISSSEKMRLDSSGNLGIAATPSAWGFGGVLQLGSYGTSFASIYGSDIAFSAYFNGGWKYQNSSYAPTWYSQDGGAHKWYNAPVGTTGNAISFTQRMTLDASGNLGVGITTPVDKLHIYGGSIRGESASSSVPGLIVMGAGPNQGWLKFGTFGTDYYSIKAGADYTGMLFFTNGTERARIDSSGNLGIGTSSPGAKLDVVGDGQFTRTVSYGGSANSFISLGGTDNGYVNNGTASAWRQYVSGNENGQSLRFDAFLRGTGWTERMRLDSSGNLGLGVTPSAWASTSRAIQLAASSSLEGRTNDGSHVALYANATWNGTNFIYQNTATASYYKQSSSVHSWYTAPAGTAGTAISFTQAMTLDAGGNLGVGATSVVGTLHIAKNDALLHLEDPRTTGDGSHTVAIGAFKNFVGYNNLDFDSARYVFKVAGTERARIDSSGNLLVGTTTSPGSPNAQIVAGGTTDPGIQLASTSNGGGLILGSPGGGIGLYTYTGAIGSESYTERMRLDASGNLGIGTSSITAIYGGNTVQLQSSSGATNYITTGTYNALVAATTDGKAHFGTSTANTSVVIETANGIALTVDATNNLGLGVTPSAWSLSGLSAFQFRNGSVYGYSTNESGLQTNAYYNSGWKYISTNPAAQYQQNNGAHAWYTAPSGTAGNAISFTQRMTLDASGNLGIGTSSPSYKLDLQGAAGLGLRVLETSTGTNKRVHITQESAYVKYEATYSTGGNAHSWWSGGARQMDLDTSGNLGIGTTSPQTKLHILSNANALALEGNTGGHTYMSFYPRGFGAGRKAYIGFGADATGILDINNEADGNLRYSTSATNYQHSFRVVTTERLNVQDWGAIITGNLIVGNGTSGEKQLTLSNSNRYLYYYLTSDGQSFGVWDLTGGYNRFYSDVSGNFWIRGTLTQNSDERLKTNWQDLPVDYVQKLAGVKSGAYSRTDIPNSQYVGVSAQSLQPVLPQAVGVDNTTGMLSVDYGSAALVSSIELAKKLVEQEQRIAKLEAIIERMQNV